MSSGRFMKLAFIIGLEKGGTLGGQGRDDRGVLRRNRSLKLMIKIKSYIFKLMIMIMIKYYLL